MGTLALANMVPKMEPDSQWMTALLSQALTPFFLLFFLFFVLSLCQLWFTWFQSNRFLDVWELTYQTCCVRKQVLRQIDHNECFSIRQASTWPTIAREVGEGPDGSGHPSDWWGRGLGETHNQRKCIALWRAYRRATSFIIYHRQNRAENINLYHGLSLDRWVSDESIFSHYVTPVSVYEECNIYFLS